MYRHAAVALFIALSLAACGGVTDPSKNKQETFGNGDVLKPGVQASFSYPFNVANTGELTIAVTSMNPVVPTNTFFTVGYGIPQSGLCSPINYNTASTVGFPAISGDPVTAGPYCVFIQDEGFLTVPETFTISVSHP